MNNITSIVLEPKKQLNSNSRRGFASHPENINKGGRPKKDWTWADLFVDAAEELKDTKQGKMQVKKIIAKRLFHMAMSGNVQAIKEVIDRMDGKSVEKAEVDVNLKHMMVVFDNE